MTMTAPPVAAAVPPPAAPTPDAYQQMIAKTWLYLRLGMIALPAGIGVAVVYEWRQTQHHADGTCLQGSISAYYYTPAGPMLIGALIGIGLCLYALRGNTDKEDVLLNIAGMFAPMVALVPTPGPGQCSSDRAGSTLIGLTEDDATVLAARTVLVHNGMAALLFMVWGGLVVLAVQYVVQSRKQGWYPSKDEENRLFGACRLLGYGVTFALWIAVTVLYFTAFDWFLQYMHHVAAITMFGAVIVVVIVNACRARKAKYRLTYTTIAAAMVVSAGFFFGHMTIDDHGLLWSPWAQWLLWLEVSEIALFSAFWIVQTIHGRAGLVEPSPPAVNPPTVPALAEVAP